MCFKREGNGRLNEFAKETIYNIRRAIEDMKRCERRAQEHLAEAVKAALARFLRSHQVSCIRFG